MSELNPILEVSVEKPEKEDVERVAYCTGAYLSAFSKPPFDEKWSVDGEVVSGVVLNPKTTGDFVKEFLIDDATEIFSTEDGGERIRVRRELVESHVSNTLDCPMTEYLFESDYFDIKDVTGLVELGRKLKDSDEEFVELYAPFPLTDIVGSYVKTMKDPFSMVLLGYQEADVFDFASEVNFVRIQKSTEVSEDLFPRVVCRYTTANSPKSYEKQNVHDFILNEVAYYLDEEQKKKVKEKINPDSYTTFFGELAKIPSTDKALKVLPLVGARYIEIITSQPEDGRHFEFLDLISEQLVFLSIKGTSVLSESDVEPGKTKLFEGVMGLLGSLGLHYEEEVLKFKNSQNQEIVIGILKRLDKQEV